MNEKKRKMMSFTPIFWLLQPIIICGITYPISANPIYKPSANEIAATFFEENKLLLIILSSVIILILLGILIFYFLHRKTNSDSGPAERHPVTLDSRTTRQPGGRPHVLSIGSIQGQGQRENQQDAIGISRKNRNGQLFVVADGMGGLENGQASAQIAVTAFLNAFQSRPVHQNQIPTALKSWIVQSNQKIWQTFQGLSGTTLICVWLTHNHLYWISAGDSSLYLLREERLYRINEIHNRISDLYLSFMHENITADELMNAEQKENLTSNLGRETIPVIDQNHFPFEIQSGDRFLLCTDGVSGFSDEDIIIKTLQLSDAQQCCSALNQYLVDKKCADQDNYSAVAIFC